MWEFVMDMKRCVGVAADARPDARPEGLKSVREGAPHEVTDKAVPRLTETRTKDLAEHASAKTEFS
jgi:hypothetical protein